MLDVAVIDGPAAAEVSLDPVRARLLAALAEPGSASTLAAGVGLTRQKANYHLRALERHGLVELIEERKKGNCIERWMQATAASYVISPTALAVSPPTLASTSSKISTGISSSAASTVLSASITRAISPDEAMARSGRAGSPGLGANWNSMVSKPEEELRVES